MRLVFSTWLEHGVGYVIDHYERFHTVMTPAVVVAIMHVSAAVVFVLVELLASMRLLRCGDYVSEHYKRLFAVVVTDASFLWLYLRSSQLLLWLLGWLFYSFRGSCG